jgi:hypothetical protein
MALNEILEFNSLAVEKLILNKMVVINSKNGLDVLKKGENVIAVEVHSNNATAINVVFDSQLIDNNNTIIYKLGSEWNYFDKGFIPQNQLINKTTDIKSETNFPTGFILYQNYPNPFNPNTTISYQLLKNSFVSLKVYDVLGREVKTLVNEYQLAGNYNSQFSILPGGRQILHSKFNSGIYFYTLRAGEYTETKKMLLIK